MTTLPRSQMRQEIPVIVLRSSSIQKEAQRLMELVHHFRNSPHWQFVEGKCRPTCGAAANIAGHGGIGDDDQRCTSDDPHVYDGEATSCQSLTKCEQNDWVDLEFEDAGETFTGDDTIEVRQRGGVCCVRGTAKDPDVTPEVTNLICSGGDFSKTCTWSCSVSGCQYRHQINKSKSHTFSEIAQYNTTRSVTKNDATSAKTTYYIHVQALKQLQSVVKTRQFTVYPLPSTPEVTGISNDLGPRRNKRWNWSCTTERDSPL